jgi:branched-chain amino acid transport system ATP-binding protein
LTQDTTTATPLLTLSDVTVTFGGITALQEAAVDVHPHQILGVIGPNGAGKTTLFNVACGFVRPDTGTLAWRGDVLTGLRPHDLARLGIARTLQGLGLYSRLSVLDNVLVGADHHARVGFVSSLFALPRSSREEQALRARAHLLLDQLGIAAYADRLPDSLPYAVRKKVALARALVAEPDLLLLDEPASGLSDEEMDELGTLVRGLTERMSVMLVEHHMDLVMRVCDEIVVLDFGRVIATGSPASVRSNPAVLAAYLGDAVSRETGA